MYSSLGLFLSLLSLTFAYNLQEYYTSHDRDEYAPKYDNYIPSDYNFEYGVADPKTGDYKSQWEEKKDGVVRGVYTLLEADGTTRYVEYVADDDGFRANVKRIGTATHHHPQPNLLETKQQDDILDSSPINLNYANEYSLPYNYGAGSSLNLIDHHQNSESDRVSPIIDLSNQNNIQHLEIDHSNNLLNKIQTSPSNYVHEYAHVPTVAHYGNHNFHPFHGKSLYHKLLQLLVHLIKKSDHHHQHNHNQGPHYVKSFGNAPHNINHNFVPYPIINNNQNQVPPLLISHNNPLGFYHYYPSYNVELGPLTHSALRANYKKDNFDVKTDDVDILVSSHNFGGKTESHGLTGNDQDDSAYN